MVLPVRIEADAWNDPRYTILAGYCGYARPRFALIQCGWVWSLCTELETNVLDAEVIDAHVQEANFAKNMIKAKLAERVAGGVRVKGTEGRIEWIQQRRAAASKGGKSKASKRLARASELLEKGSSKPVAKSESTLPSVSVSVSVSEEERESACAPPPIDPPEKTPEQRAVSALRAEYSELFEQRTGQAWMLAARNDREIRDTARWSVATSERHGLEVEQTTHVVLTEFFADSRAESKVFPWGWLAKSPDEYFLRNRDVQSLIATRDASRAAE